MATRCLCSIFLSGNHDVRPLEIETHPFPPLPPQATVMMMGRFRPGRQTRDAVSLSNFQNDMWRVYGLVFFNDAAHFQRSSEKRLMRRKSRRFARTRIASCPTVLEGGAGTRQCVRNVFARVETVDLAAVLAQMPDCRHIALLAEATEVLLDIQGGGIKQNGRTVPFPFVDGI